MYNLGIVCVSVYSYIIYLLSEVLCRLKYVDRLGGTCFHLLKNGYIENYCLPINKRNTTLVSNTFTITNSWLVIEICSQLHLCWLCLFFNDSISCLWQWNISNQHLFFLCFCLLENNEFGKFAGCLSDNLSVLAD